MSPGIGCEYLQNPFNLPKRSMIVPPTKTTRSSTSAAPRRAARPAPPATRAPTPYEVTPTYAVDARAAGAIALHDFMMPSASTG